MHRGTFRPNYIFNNDACFFRFSRTKIFFDLFFNLNPFLTSTIPAFWDSKL